MIHFFNLSAYALNPCSAGLVYTDLIFVIIMDADALVLINARLLGERVLKFAQMHHLTLNLKQMIRKQRFLEWTWNGILGMVIKIMSNKTISWGLISHIIQKNVINQFCFKNKSDEWKAFIIKMNKNKIIIAWIYHNQFIAVIQLP